MADSLIYWYDRFNRGYNYPASTSPSVRSVLDPTTSCLLAQNYAQDFRAAVVYRDPTEWSPNDKLYWVLQAAALGPSFDDTGQPDVGRVMLYNTVGSENPLYRVGVFEQFGSPVDVGSLLSDVPAPDPTSGISTLSETVGRLDSPNDMFGRYIAPALSHTLGGNVPLAIYIQTVASSQGALDPSLIQDHYFLALPSGFFQLWGNPCPYQVGSALIGGGGYTGPGSGLGGSFCSTLRQSLGPVGYAQAMPYINQALQLLKGAGGLPLSCPPSA